MQMVLILVFKCRWNSPHWPTPALRHCTLSFFSELTDCKEVVYSYLVNVQVPVSLFIVQNVY